jgi:hypothetical protein
VELERGAGTVAAFEVSAVSKPFSNLEKSCIPVAAPPFNSNRPEFKKRDIKPSEICGSNEA